MKFNKNILDGIAPTTQLNIRLYPINHYYMQVQAYHFLQFNLANIVVLLQSIASIRTQYLLTIFNEHKLGFF